MKNRTKNTLKIYGRFIWKYRYIAGFVGICVLVGTGVGVALPLYYKNFFDLISSSGNRTNIVNELYKVLLAIAALEFVRWAMWRLAGFINNRFEPKAIADISNHCFEELHKHSFSYFNNNFVGTLVKRVNYFARGFEGILDQIIWNISPMIVNIVLIVFVLAKRNVLISLVMIGWMTIFLTVNWFFTKYKIKFDLERSEAESRSTALLADSITNNHNVKLFLGYRREVEAFKKAAELVRKLRTHTWDLDTIFDGVQGILTVILNLLVIYLGITFWQKGVLTVGDFILLTSYAGSIMGQAWGFGKMIRNIYTNLADAEEMTILLETPVEIQNLPAAQELKIQKGEIEFKNTVFNYNETRNIISDLSFKISSKEKVALVGSSGSGKSTIIKLLLRMHDVTGGNILIDGQNIKDVTQDSLWKNISLVPQDPILFHRTLMENIRYGKPGASDEEVIEASKLANCHGFINELTDKYNTYVGERGIKLSGGERQRVAIARAILRNAPILILDEATSSLDSESEMLIQEALNALMENKTVIVVAHRLSTIMKMDRILVIDRGNIIESGTHKSLLEKENGIYSNLWKIQAGGFLGGEEKNSEEQLFPATA